MIGMAEDNDYWKWFTYAYIRWFYDGREGSNKINNFEFNISRINNNSLISLDARILGDGVKDPQLLQA